MRDENSYIRTYTGRRFYPLDPRAEEVDIVDIAHALSLQCRFTGHTKFFYSVGQHSLLISSLCLPEYQLWGLLHDASEAYLCDIARPLKHQESFKFYREVEAKVTTAICERFQMKLPEPPAVKDIDRRMLITEQRDLMSHMTIPGEGLGNYVPYQFTITPEAPGDIEKKFMDQFGRLCWR